MEASNSALNVPSVTEICEYEMVYEYQNQYLKTEKVFKKDGKYYFIYFRNRIPEQLIVKTGINGNIILEMDYDA